LKWSDGTNIIVLVHKDKSVQKKFFEFIDVTDVMNIKKQWMRFQLSGEGKAPETVDDYEMLKKVASTPGAIGYKWHQT